MATVKLGAYGTAVTVLNSELNSLANAAVSGLSGTGTGTALDNSTNLNLYGDIELIVVFAAAPTVGNTLTLYMASTLDLTNYETMPAAGTTLPQSFKQVGVFAIETAGTSQKIHIHQVPLTPGKMEFQLANNSGQALAASGSSVALYPYSLTVV